MLVHFQYDHSMIIYPYLVKYSWWEKRCRIADFCLLWHRMFVPSLRIVVLVLNKMNIYHSIYIRLIFAHIGLSVISSEYYLQISLRAEAFEFLVLRDLIIDNQLCGMLWFQLCHPFVPEKSIRNGDWFQKSNWRKRLLKFFEIF